ncbi:MAG: GAF domain-containing protein [Bacteroidales bacterium]
MNKKKRNYLLGWIALVTLILGALLLLLIAGSDTSISFILLLLLWIMVIAPAIYLFVSATDRFLKEMRNETPSGEVVSPSRSGKRISAKQESFDIKGAAAKIVRRIDPTGDPKKWGGQLLKLLVTELEIMSGIFYHITATRTFESFSTYAYPHTSEPYSFREGEGLTGQAVKNRQVTILRSIPDDYMAVFSGLGSGKPAYLAIVPILSANEPVAVVEIAGFRWSEENLEQFFQIITRELTEKISSGSSDGKSKEKKND